MSQIEYYFGIINYKGIISIEIDHSAYAKWSAILLLCKNPYVVNLLTLKRIFSFIIIFISGFILGKVDTTLINKIDQIIAQLNIVSAIGEAS
jgi:hypothetical protein